MKNKEIEFFKLKKKKYFLFEYFKYKIIGYMTFTNLNK